MSRKNRVLLFAVACVLATAAPLSNELLDIEYLLSAPSPGVSASGLNMLALPYVREAGINTAVELFHDIGGPNITGNPVGLVYRFNKSNDTFAGHRPGMSSPFPNFALVAGDGYLVSMVSTVNYVIVGAHDPALVVTLHAREPGVSATGKNLFAPPYDILAADAEDLMLDIGGGELDAVASVARFVRSSNTWRTFTARMGSPSPDFPLVAGEAYLVTMNTTVPYIPSHF